MLQHGAFYRPGATLSMFVVMKLQGYNVIMSSERDLWSAVLSQAIEDLTDSRADAKAFGTRLWFMSDNYEPGSFLWICDHLELNASSIRRVVVEHPSGSDRVKLAG